MFRSMRNLALVLTLYPVIFQLIKGYAIDEKDKESANSISKPSSQQSNQLLNANADTRRPIWNLAHMVNSIKELDYRLGKGANAVEVDVTFGKDGDPLFTYHGPPCDCWRHCHQQEDFHEYLRYVREIAIDEREGMGKNLTLLFLDLKLDYLDTKGKARAGTELAKSIVSNLYLDSEASSGLSSQAESALAVGSIRVASPMPKRILRLMLSVNHVTDMDLVNNFLHFMEQNNSSHLMDRIGFDVGMNDDINQIESMWKRFGNSLNLWQGDGFTNCFSPFYNLERLSKALSKRDHSQGYPRKVYQWTIDLHDRMREALRMGVDAVMTNHPERMLTVLREPEMAHNFRLATSDDDPFKKIIVRASARNNELARHQRSTSSGGGGILASMYDVLVSWFTYIKEIPFFSLPTTSRLFAGSGKRQRGVNITLTNLNVPEYRVDSHSDQNSTTTTTTTTNPNSTTTTQVPISDSADQNQNQTLSEQPYEGPKWYTSLISNVLVSALKVVLPT